MENFREYLRTGAAHISGKEDVLLLLALLVVLLLFLIVRRRSLRRRSHGLPAGKSVDRTKAMMGRLEKLDMTLNEFRTDFMRWQEFSGSELRQIRSSLKDIKTALRGEVMEEEAEVRPAPGETKTEEEPAPAAKEKAPARTGGPEETERLTRGLRKTRESLFGRLSGVFSKKSKLDEEMLEELEGLLISSDLGVSTASALLEDLRMEVKGGKALRQPALVQRLKDQILKILIADVPVRSEILPWEGVSPLVVMVVGVNGSGKTTTVAKLAYRWKEMGLRVLVVAADTFRAAAVEQLTEWTARIGVPVVTGPEGSKPSAIVFNAMQKVRKETFDIMIIDTAGRLHTKSNLMQELEGIRNVIKRHNEKAPHETILVVDGSTGQNGLAQAKEFNAAVPLTGLVVTKLDGTPKGGIVVAIKDEVGVPVRYVGVGESKEDLRPFDAAAFADALLGGDGDGSASGQIHAVG